MKLHELQNYIWCCFNEPEWAEEMLRRIKERNGPLHVDTV